MNKKYLNFSLILIVLSVFDIITTQCALSTYPHLKEGNPIMALVTSSFALFVLVKAIGVLVIVNIYKRIRAQSEMAAKIGQTVIILMMLFVVGNNLIWIGGASVSYYYVTPNSIEYPGRPEIDGSNSYAFLSTNGSEITEILGYNGTSGYLTYTYNRRIHGGAGTLKFAVADWVHPNRIYFVDSSANVLYTDSTYDMNLSKGYKTYGANPDDCPTCDAIYKIGVLTRLNIQMSGFVDSNGDLLLAESNTIVKFTRSTDFTKTTYLTASGYPSVTTPGTPYYDIVDMTLDPIGYIHFIVSTGSSYVGYSTSPHTFSASINHNVFNYATATYVYNQVLVSGSVVLNGYPQSYGFLAGSILALSNTTNYTQAIVSYPESGTGGNIILKSYNGTSFNDICPTFCSSITSITGLQIINGYAYLASSAQNYIYRYPTIITASSGSGYVVGAGTESTDVPDLTYDTKSINSMYASYYNTSKFVIQSHIKFESGYYAYPPTVNYGIVNEAYRWQYRLIDPNGVSVKTWDSSACDYGDTTLEKYCELSTKEELTAPSTGWQSGSWYVKLYEHKIDTTLFGDAPKGNLALLTTSAAWTVLNQNESANSTGTIGNPEESLDSPDNLQTISQIDGYVGLLGFGVNSVSKFLFALIFAVVLFVIGMYYGKSGMIGLALSSFPYVFFAFIGYIPKWVFIIYVILLIVISKVFR